VSGLELENHVTLHAAEVEATAILRIVTVALPDSPEGIVGIIRHGSDDTTIQDASAHRIGSLLEIGHQILLSQGDETIADGWWEAGAFDALSAALKDGEALEQEAAAWGIWNLMAVEHHRPVGQPVVLEVIRLLRYGSADGKEAAAGALGNLMSNSNLANASFAAEQG